MVKTAKEWNGEREKERERITRITREQQMFGEIVCLFDHYVLHRKCYEPEGVGGK